MKKVMIGAALLALAAGQVQAQPSPGDARGGHGGWRGGAEGVRGPGGGFRGGGGGERPAFRQDGGDRGQFRAGGGFEQRSPVVPQAQPAGAPGQHFGGRGFQDGRRFDGGQELQGRRWAGQTPAQPAQPGPPAEARGADVRRFDGGRPDGQGFAGDRRLDDGRFQGQRFSGDGDARFGRDRNRRFDDGRFQGQRFGGDGDRRFGGGDRGQGLGGQRFGGQGFGGQRFGGEHGGWRSNRAFSYRGQRYSAFRAAPYRFPQGYSYQRYGVRSRLPFALLTSTWFLNDYWSYNLAPPPAQQFQWIRYGPDALLVDTYTGEVVDAAYGVFDEEPGFDYYGTYGDPSYDGGYRY